VVCGNWREGRGGALEGEKRPSIGAKET